MKHQIDSDYLLRLSGSCFGLISFIYIFTAVIDFVKLNNFFTLIYVCRCIYLTSCSLQEDPPAGVSGAPTENNIMLWNAVIFGYDVSSSNIDVHYSFCKCHSKAENLLLNRLTFGFKYAL